MRCEAGGSRPGGDALLDALVASLPPGSLLVGGERTNFMTSVWDGVASLVGREFFLARLHARAATTLELDLRERLLEEVRTLEGEGTSEPAGS